MGNEVKQLILEALQIGLESAQEEAGHYHQTMAGYRQYRHDALDADVEKIKTAIAIVNNLSFDNAK
jgi:hypothetical protein